MHASFVHLCEIGFNHFCRLLRPIGWDADDGQVHQRAESKESGYRIWTVLTSSLSGATARAAALSSTSHPHGRPAHFWSFSNMLSSSSALMFRLTVHQVPECRWDW